MEKILLEKEFINELENQEAQYWSDYYLCCGNPLSRKLGLDIKIIGNSVCCSASELDILAFNRVIGVGLDFEINKKHLSEIISFYKGSRARRFFVQISPAAQSNNYARIMNEMGFQHYNNWAKFYKKLENKVPEIESDLIVEELKLSETDLFDKIIKEAFEFGGGAESLFTQTFKKYGWKHYLAKEGDKPIAAASMFIYGKNASFAIAGTLPEARGRGAQSALIVKRINDAIEAGCEYLVVETEEDKPEKSSASNRNVRKFGFELAYHRPNYIYYF